MDKQLRQHERFVAAEIERIEHEQKTGNAKNTTLRPEVEKLRDYHDQAVRNFQHERFIHLVVTLFFAVLLLLSIGGVFWVISLPSASAGTSVPVVAISGILLVTELFYLWHYYLLENGTQRLYKLSRRLFELQ